MTLNSSSERHLPFEGCYNIRDIGGYATSDGHTTRWRIIFRADNVNRLAPHEQQRLLGHGIRTVLDLRDSSEVKKVTPVFSRHETVKYVNLPLYGDEIGSSIMMKAKDLYELYCLVLDERREQFRTALELVATSANLPLLLHCAVGKDRTGMVSALLLAAANVPAETIAGDYALSETNLRPLHGKLLEVGLKAGHTREHYQKFLEARHETMLQVFDFLEQKFGGTSGYFEAIGLSEETVSQLRARLVE